MKIGIVSDTHGNVANFKKVVEWLNKENIKLILHAGDIGNPESLRESLENFGGEFLGVFGNMDADFKKDLTEYNFKKIKVAEKVAELELDGKKIVITHFPAEAKELAQSGKYDLVFYGHTHKPCLDRQSPARLAGALAKRGEDGGRTIKECLLANPGELAGQYNKPTFAVYDTITGNLELKILEKL